MADSTTANYSWAYPTVNADADTWGTTLNNTIIAVDAALKSVENAAPKKGSNLSDLGSAGTARTNLGLGTAATHAATDFLTPSTGLQVANNLSDVTAATARTNLGLGTGAVVNITVQSGGSPSGGNNGDIFVIV